MMSNDEVVSPLPEQPKEATAFALAGYREALDNMPTCVYMKDTLGRYVYANRMTLELFGVTEEELSGSDDTRFFPADTVERLRAVDRRVFAGEQTTEEIDITDTRHGRRVYLELKMPLYDDASRTAVRGLLGISTDITARKRLEEVQTFLAQSGQAAAGEPFFNALARYLAETLDMEYVCIDSLEGDGLSARTVAVWCDGAFDDNVSYALKDTPCGDVVGKAVCCFPAGVSNLFPRDQTLRDLRAESYVGVTLWGHTGSPVGLIAVIGRAPLKDRNFAEAVLERVAGRAAGEFERLEAEAALARQMNELRRWQSALLGREQRILEMKREVNGLLAELGRPARYASAAETRSDHSADSARDGAFQPAYGEQPDGGDTIAAVFPDRQSASLKGVR